MPIGEKLLNLTLEYQRSIEARQSNPELDRLGGTPVGREPSVISDEYATTLKLLLTGE